VKASTRSQPRQALAPSGSGIVKRRKNKKLHNKRDGASAGAAAPASDRESGTRASLPRQGPSELDQIKAFIYGPEGGRRAMSLPGLRALDRRLPFEPVMVQVARLNARVKAVIIDRAGQWDLARSFYEGDDDLLPPEEPAANVTEDPEAVALAAKVKAHANQLFSQEGWNDHLEAFRQPEDEAADVDDDTPTREGRCASPSQAGPVDALDRC
jgi:hypothetical protein